MIHFYYRKSTAMLSLAATLLFGLAGSADATDSRTLVVAQAIDLSGPNADFGRDFSLGAKIYFDYANASGGVNGHRILYRQTDTTGSGTRSLAAAQAFLKDGAQVLFGFSGNSAVAAVAQDPLIRNSGIPIFAPVIGSLPVGPQDSLFLLRSDLATEIRALVSHLTTSGIRNFGLAVAEDYGSDPGAVVEAELARHSAKLVAHTTLTAGESSDAAARRIAQAKPQAVIVLADTLAVAQFARRYRTLDPGTFLGAPSMVNVRTLVTAAGPEAARGLIVSQVVPTPTASLEIAREHRRLMERYADEPLSQATLEGFVAAKALVQMLRRGRDLSRQGIQQALRDGGRLDLGGFNLNIAKAEPASTFVELTVVSREGRLLR